MHKYWGFIGNRLRRLFRRPDMDWVLTNSLAIGGKTKCPDIFEVIDLTKAETIPEGEYPLFGHVNSTVDYIHELIEQGKKVFVHCRVGRGRAPLIAIYYLMKYHNLHLLEAIIYVKSRRPFVYLNDKQMRFLRDYYKRIKNE